MPPAAASGAVVGVRSIRSPFPSLARTRILLDAIGLEVLSDYTPTTAGAGAPRLSDRSGVLLSRYFSKRVANAVRTVEVVVTAHPGGGHVLYLGGWEGDGRHGGEPNPELPEIEASIERLVADLATADVPRGGPIEDRRRLGYETYQLSYVEADRAIGVLKALGYTTVEFQETSGETLYDRIFMPSAGQVPGEPPRPEGLPIVVKMISASKTSLQESTADSGTFSFGGRDGLPDLGGIFLHRTTAAEPQNRLLIAYDPFDLEALEQLMNLLRNVIDLPARQIVLEALVIEVEGDVSRDLGVSWTAERSGDGGRNTFGLRIEDEPRAAPPPLTFLFSRVTDSVAFNLRLQALLQTRRAKILSNPSVLVLDGRQAKIQIGSRIPVIEATVTQTSVTESVLYFPVGIVLNIRPRLSGDGSEISMQVETIVSSARQTAVGVGTGTRAPEVESRQVQTFVRVQNDTPFIIGGLTTNDELASVRGVPLLSSIPGLGVLFSRQIKRNVQKEIIIVVTPHLMPEDPRTFSYAIPQASPMFDSFGRQLLYNAYRVRPQDVYDLDFVVSSRAYQSLVECAARYVESMGPRRLIDADILALLDGAVPGEDVLVRRMLWEIVRKTDYLRFVDLDRFILFENLPGSAGGFDVAFLAPKLARLEPKKEALVLAFDVGAEGTPDRPFTQPTGALSYEPVTPVTFADRLAAGNRRSQEGFPQSWSILLTDSYSGTAAPFDVLRGVTVLKWILALNPNLPLTIRGFQPGLQIVFPTEGELAKGYHLVDPQAAKLFFEVTAYYPAFEEEFKHLSRRLAHRMGGCEWWDAARGLDLEGGT
jgi:hypothetical protein